MSMGIEAEQPFGIIEEAYKHRPPQEVRFSVQPLSNDQFLVHHPFHKPTTVGNQSAFSDRFVDTAASILMGHLSYLADSRKLNRTHRFETRPNAGEFSQLSHCFSAGLMSSEFAGGPAEIFDALFNDAPHVYSGHQGDDNYQGHGREDLHDATRGDFFARSGLMRRFVEEGVLRQNGYGYCLGNTKYYVARLLDEDEATVRPTFVSNKHPSRRMDNDRFQYSEEERLFVEVFRHRRSKDPLIIPRTLAQRALDDVQRTTILADGEGDQLVFSNLDTAEASALAYAEHNAMHWCEPVQDLVNDLLNFAERYFFVCDDDTARNFQYFYPRDYLHTSATLMFERFDEVAKNDPFMKWLLDTAEQIANDQRKKMSNIIDEKTSYVGPNPPAGVQLEQLAGGVDSLFRVVEGGVEVLLPRGKMRSVDPRIIISKEKTKPLSKFKGSTVTEEARNLQKWIGDYRAEIAVQDKADLEMIRTGIQRVNNRWPRALQRTPMSDGVLQTYIAEANKFVVSGKL